MKKSILKDLIYVILKRLKLKKKKQTKNEQILWQKSKHQKKGLINKQRKKERKKETLIESLEFKLEFGEKEFV